MALVGSWGCSPGLSDLANFIDSPFGNITGTVTDLDEDGLSAVMTELMLRFRTYLSLREALPFADIAPEACISEVDSAGDGFSFVADVSCTFGDRFEPTAGTIFVNQTDIAQAPVAVTELEVVYRGVVVGELSVDGSEHITETGGDGGASVRQVDVVQGGVELDYEFRLGLVDDDVPVFDYEIPSGGDVVLARVSNPSSAGALVSVILTGLDGALMCEVRDAAWAPGELARGVCDNGLTFGLP